MAKKALALVIILLVVIFGWSLLNDKAVEPVTNNTEVNVPDTANPDTANTVEPQTITVSGSEFSYAPNTISAQVGQAVTVVYTNAGKYPHNFVIDELGVKSQTINAGETDTFTFTPTKAGAFPFYCSLPNHLERGMVGTISVK